MPQRNEVQGHALSLTNGVLQRFDRTHVSAVQLVHEGDYGLFVIDRVITRILKRLIHRVVGGKFSR